MRKKLLTLFLGLTGILTQVDATCPLKRFYPVKQSDGTTIEVCKHGNGHFVFYSTREGWTLMPDANGDMQYAVKTQHGLSLTGVLAHGQSAHTVPEEQIISTCALPVAEAYQWMKSKNTQPRRVSRTVTGEDGLVPLGTTGPGIVKSIGAPVIPVIMVSFPDRDFLPETTPEKVSRLLNEKGYHDEKYCKGSVKDYFTSQSNGLFTPSFKVVAQVKASRPYAYYGENYLNGDVDKNAKELVREALDSAVVAGVDLKQFSNKGNHIPLVSIYYAGPGEHSSFEKGCEDYIWAHFSERTFQLKDVTVDSYFVGNETMQQYKIDEMGEIQVIGAKFDGMGIFVHEFGHALGLPDFYSTDTNSEEQFETMHYWSIMDYGQYFYDSYAPVGYNAFERASLGWLALTELNEPQYAELYPFGKEENGPTAYCIRNKANPKEYYILENRQPDTWYSKLMGSGMLITHVDYDQSRWDYNNLNTEKDHQRFEFIPADNMKRAVKEDGLSDWNGIKGDLFPGINNVTEFTDTTLPASHVYVGGTLNQPIYNIKEYEGVVSFSFMDKAQTGLNQLLDDQKTGQVEVYTLAGHKLSADTHLMPGLYILKKDGQSRKIYVRP